MAHTKGKWAYNDSATSEPNALAIIADGIYIADCYSLGKDSCQAEPEEVEANACLIAAAPAMLDALESVISYCTNKEILIKIHKVLKQARGV
ncbi:hypothetical protein LCGC14_2172110 [marine sediment metagenome]|uniref:Uncharacterized protein n=1 Tax=marine sediment metagenome TaxID=412755 RepID=A0A0F9GKM6_9ZZZZ